MTAQIRPAPVRKSVTVKASPERAFDIFANGIDRWWPRSHQIGKAPIEREVLEPRADGRWFERGTNGVECDIGKVLVWDPPARLVLAWQLDADWVFNPDLITEVDVRFTPEGDGTRVELEHRHLERMGAAAEQLRAQIDSPNGWGMLLQLYSEAV